MSLAITKNCKIIKLEYTVDKTQDQSSIIHYIILLSSMIQNSRTYKNFLFVNLDREMYTCLKAPVLIFPHITVFYDVLSLRLKICDSLEIFFYSKGRDQFLLFSYSYKRKQKQKSCLFNYLSAPINIYYNIICKDQRHSNPNLFTLQYYSNTQ